MSKPSIKDFINKKVKEYNNSPNSIEQLILDNMCKGSEVEGLTDAFTDLEILSMNNIGLNSLAGLPRLPKLRRLEATDNRISTGLESLGKANLKNLTTLKLSGNKIKNFSDLQPLSYLQSLEVLDLFGCEVTKEKDYAKRVFELIPHLKVLDGFNQKGEEVDEEEEDDEEDEEDDEEEGEDEEGDGDEGDEEDGDNEGAEDEENDEENDNENENGAENGDSDSGDSDEPEEEGEEEDSEEDDEPEEEPEQSSTSKKRKAGEADLTEDSGRALKKKK